MALCLLFHKKRGAPTLYFICHRRFSVLQQCPIVSMKFSGSLKRRILYYYVPAKFRSLFSFGCSQRAHNLLSAARPATKLHCCSANRPVSVDGSAHCEVCLSAAAAGGSLGTPSLRRAVKMKKRNDGGRKEIRKKDVKQKSSLSCLQVIHPFRRGNGLSGAV